MDRSSPSVGQSASDVSGALIPRIAEISADIYGLLVRKSRKCGAISGNVTTMLYVMHHGIDLDKVHAPAAAEEYARQLAQRAEDRLHVELVLLASQRLGAAVLRQAGSSRP